MPKRSKSKLCFADVIDILHNVFRYSGFVFNTCVLKRYQPGASGNSAYKAGSWLNAPITLEQVRVERYLDQKDLNGKTLLYVGIGSSSMATKYHAQCRWIDGITVMEDELKYGQDLKLARYGVFLMNKYTDQIAELPNTYDYIVDTNPSSFASTETEFTGMMERYAQLLNPGGMILMDRLGMHFHESHAFGIDDDDLRAFEKTLPLKFQHVNRTLRALVRT